MIAPAAPRPSATICLLRDGPQGLEVMMGRRGAAAKFMANAWVFPGGSVDEADKARSADLVRGKNDPAQLPWILAALRESVEEAGIWLTSPPRAEGLGGRDVFALLDEQGEFFEAEAVYFANWVTPADLPIRYDARFFAAVVDADLTPIPDEDEIDEAVWIRPAEAILRAQSRWLVPFPTHVTLEQLAKAPTASAFMEMAAGLPVETVQPRIRVEADGSLSVVMPHEPGFDDLPEVGMNPGDLAGAAERGRRARNSIAELE